MQPWDYPDLVLARAGRDEQTLIASTRLNHQTLAGVAAQIGISPQIASAWRARREKRLVQAIGAGELAFVPLRSGRNRPNTSRRAPGVGPALGTGAAAWAALGTQREALVGKTSDRTSGLVPRPGIAGGAGLTAPCSHQIPDGSEEPAPTAHHRWARAADCDDRAPQRAVAHQPGRVGQLDVRADPVGPQRHPCPLPARHRDPPTQKSVELLDLLVRYACLSNGLVVDPFTRSGSTGIAARAAGRSAILVEANVQHRR